jgi:hypothetical protein
MNMQYKAPLEELLELICDDFSITPAPIFSSYNRGRVSKARQIFALSSTDAGVPHLAVSLFLNMDPSYVTQVRRRKHALRRTAEYHHAYGYIHAKLGAIRNANT